jgi:hypothetical protein
MNPLLMTGVSIVLCAFAAYSASIIALLKTHRPGALMRGFLTAGVALDATATAFMIAGSRRLHLTFHGVWGYSALLLMAVDLTLVWIRVRSRPAEPLPARLNLYSIIAYSWWVLAFAAGIIVAASMNAR